MDINGIITAKSEIICLKSGFAFLFAIHNKYSDVTFYIFVQGPWLLHWKKNIVINQCYVLSDLKTCVLKTKHGKDIEMCRAISRTKFKEIAEEDILPMNFTPAFGSVMFRQDSSHIDAGPSIISYEGCITSVRNADLGIYELDGKILLYTTFLKLNTVTSSLYEGFTVLICKAHLIEYRREKNLVCCGLSSVEIVKPCETKVDSATEENDCLKFIHNLSLNFSDLKWMEGCLKMLAENFYHSIIISSANQFSWNSETMETVIINLAKCRNSMATENPRCSNRCIIQEFTSDPHSCVITSQSDLGREFVLQSISDILSGFKENAIWNYNSKSWKCSSIHVKDDVVLAGMLHVTKDGIICIADSTSKVPVIFCGGLKQRDRATFDSEAKLCKALQSSKVLAAVKDFHVISEKITVTDVKYADFCICCRTSSVFPLLELADTTDEHNNFPEHFFTSSPQELNAISHEQNYPITHTGNAQSSFNPFKTSEKKYHGNSCDDDTLSTMFERSLSLETSSDIPESDQISTKCINRGLFICGKTAMYWRDSIIYQQVFVLHLGSVPVTDFPEQSNTISSTYLCSPEVVPSTENAPPTTAGQLKPVILRFKGPAVHNCGLLFVNCFYNMLTPVSYSSGIDDVYSNSHESCQSGLKYSEKWDDDSLIDVSLSTRFILNTDLEKKFHTFLKENHSFLPKKYSVEDILHKRSLNKRDFVRGIIVDKWIDTNQSESPVNVTCENSGKKRTLTFILKDCETPNNIRAYASHFTLPVHGLIPGATVEVFGFLCLCSKKGNLYLKSSGPFGMHLLEINDDLAKEISNCGTGKYLQQEERIPWNFLSRVVAGDKLKLICFILKIWKVDIFVACPDCRENSPKSCVCSSETFVKAKASFLVDDGSAQGIVHCADQNVQVLLSLDRSEWSALTSHVQETGQSLVYDHKASEECAVSAAHMHKTLFHLLCSSSLIRRQVVLECRSYSSSDYVSSSYGATDHGWDNSKWLRLFAFSVYEPKSRDITLEYLNHVKKVLK